MDENPSTITGFEIGIFLVVGFFVLLTFFPHILNGSFEGIIFFVYKLFFAVLPFALAIFLGWLTFKMWVHYVQQDFISGIEYVVLEIVPPREVLRNPKAMELFFTNALFHWSEKGGREEFWQGAVWFWFSLEIVSLEGQVHFYIRTPSRIRSLIETQMYAQYPQAQVKLAEDYTLGVDEISPKSSWMGWGCEFGLEKHFAYPIKTYVDFGLDKDPKEEYKVDPISPVIEFFGSLEKNEQAWMQVVIRPSKQKYKVKGTWFGTHLWVDEAREELFNLLKPYTAKKGKGQELGTDSRVEIRVPDFLKRATERMSAKTSKIGFDTGVRIMYIAKKEAYQMNNRRNIRLIFRQYTAPDVNGLKRINSAQGDAFGSQFFGLSQKQVMILANRMLHEYRERAFWHLPIRHHLLSIHAFHRMMPVPGLQQIFMTLAKQIFLPYFHHETYVLNTEELATLWHFPGQILKVPTLERIESKEAAPPTNLPV
jgi:hypothetical protein